jgi:hypothetical protein
VHKFANKYLTNIKKKNNKNNNNNNNKKQNKQTKNNFSTLKDLISSKSRPSQFEGMCGSNLFLAAMSIKNFLLLSIESQ